MFNLFADNVTKHGQALIFPFLTSIKFLTCETCTLAQKVEEFTTDQRMGVLITLSEQQGVHEWDTELLHTLCV